MQNHPGFGCLTRKFAKLEKNICKCTQIQHVAKLNDFLLCEIEHFPADFYCTGVNVINTSRSPKVSVTTLFVSRLNTHIVKSCGQKQICYERLLFLIGLFKVGKYVLFVLDDSDFNFVSECLVLEDLIKLEFIYSKKATKI